MEFQEAIRRRFPELEERQSFQLRVTAGIGAQAPSAEVSGRSFQFRTSDGAAFATLSVDAYAISTSQYSDWDDFADDLALVHNAAMAAYGLPYAKRVGLRYVNQLDAEHTGLQTFSELQGLLRPELSALMTTEAWDRPEELISQILLNDDSGRLLLRVIARATEQQPVILLDLDFFEEGEIPLENLAGRCNRYHDIIYRAFRWAIHPDKLVTFKPDAKESRDNDRNR